MTERTNNADAARDFVRNKVGVVFRSSTSVSVEGIEGLTSLLSNVSGSYCLGRPVGQSADRLSTAERNVSAVSVGRLLCQESKGEMVWVGTLF